MWDKTIETYMNRALRYVICQMLGALIGVLYTHRETVTGYLVCVAALVVMCIGYYIFIWYNWKHSKETEYTGRTFKGAAYMMEYDEEAGKCRVYGDYRLIPLYTRKSERDGKRVQKAIKGEKVRVLTFMGKRYILEDKEKGYWKMLEKDGVWKVLSFTLFCVLEWSVIYFFETDLNIGEIISILIFVTVASLPNFRWREE